MYFASFTSPAWDPSTPTTWSEYFKIIFTPIQCEIIKNIHSCSGKTFYFISSPKITLEFMVNSFKLLQN